MSEFREYLNEQLQDPDFKAEYDALEDTFVTIQAMIDSGKNCELTWKQLVTKVKPLLSKYHVKAIYLFGSYARGEAREDSDMDFLVFGGEGFKLTSVLALGEELREILQKEVDIFEIREINEDSEFYKTIMKEKILVAKQ